MQDASKNAIAVVVVNYGSIAMIEENFAGLADSPDCEIVVVDNFSSADEQRRVRETCDRHGWTAVLCETNTGFGLGVNAGVQRGRDLGADAFLLLNPDAVIDAATLRELHDHARRQPNALIAPRIIRPDGTDWSVGFAMNTTTGQMRRCPGLRDLRSDEVPWLTGACLALSRELAERIGGMADGYFLYWEDVDYSLTAQAVGGSLVVRDDLTVVHSEGGTQRPAHQTRRFSDRYYFYNCRNRLVYASLHLSRRQILQWIVRTPRQSYLILLRGGRRQLLESPRPLMATVAGSLAGLGIALRGMLRSASDQHPAHNHLLSGRIADAQIKSR